MNIGKPVLFVISLSLCSGAFGAPIYKSVDEQGNVVYTDDPDKEAKPVDLPPLSTYPAQRIPPADVSPQPQDEQGTAGYHSLSVSQPAPDGTVRDNTGRVEVRAVLDPDLREEEGHRFRFYLDGKAMGKPLKVPKTSFTNVDRGAHQVEVAVVNAAGDELKRSASVRFYLHRQSQNFPFGPKPASPGGAASP